jgi:hypothetical protein
MFFMSSSVMVKVGQENFAMLVFRAARSNPVCVPLISVLSGLGLAEVVSSLLSPVALPEVPKWWWRRRSSERPTKLEGEPRPPQTPDSKRKTKQKKERARHSQHVVVASSEEEAVEGVLSKCLRYTGLLSVLALIWAFSLHQLSLAALPKRPVSGEIVPSASRILLAHDAAQMVTWLRENTLDTCVNVMCAVMSLCCPVLLCGSTPGLAWLGLAWLGLACFAVFGFLRVRLGGCFLDDAVLRNRYDDNTALGFRKGWKHSPCGNSISDLML